MGQGRTLAIGVITGQNHRTAVVACAAEIGVFKHIAAAIHPGPLAVPNAIDAIELRAWKHLKNLAAHHRRGAQLLIESWEVHDIMLFEKPPHPGQRQVIACQGRALIPGNERPGSQLCRRIAPVLIDRQANQRLNPREIDLPSATVSSRNAIQKPHRLKPRLKTESRTVKGCPVNRSLVAPVRLTSDASDSFGL